MELQLDFNFSHFSCGLDRSDFLSNQIYLTIGLFTSSELFSAHSVRIQLALPPAALLSFLFFLGKLKTSGVAPPRAP